MGHIGVGRGAAGSWAKPFFCCGEGGGSMELLFFSCWIARIKTGLAFPVIPIDREKELAVQYGVRCM